MNTINPSGASKSATLQDYANIVFKDKPQQSDAKSDAKELADSARMFQFSKDGQPYLAQARTGASLRVTALIIAFGKIFNIDLTDKFKQPNDERMKAAHNNFAQLMKNSIGDEDALFSVDMPLTRKNTAILLQVLSAEQYDQLLTNATAQ